MGYINTSNPCLAYLKRDYDDSSGNLPLFYRSHGRLRLYEAVALRL